VKKQNNGIPNHQAIQIPAPVIAQYNSVRLFIDIFWVNGSPYFHTISEWIKFRTVAAIKNRTKATILAETQTVINFYKARGFTITRVEADQEFSCIENELLPTPLNVADADDHVAEVERSIRTIKERTRCLVQGLPFKRIPRTMMRAAIENANKVLNLFPAKNRVSDTMSPLTIMTGRPTPNYNDMKIEFGSYAQVFESNEPTNTVKARTTGAIALTPTGNTQGGYNFLSLATGRKLSRQQWDMLPMPDRVIAAVELMAAAENQPLVGQGAPLFEWSPGVAIIDEEPTQIIQEEGDASQIEVIEGNDEEEEEGFGPEDAPEEEIDNEIVNDNDEEAEEGDLEGLRSDDGSDAVETIDEIEEEGLEDATETAPEEDADEEEVETEEPRRHNLRSNRERDYSNRLGHIMDNPANNKSYDTQFLQNGEVGENTLRKAVLELQNTGSNTKVFKYVTGFMMTQMTAKAGIKKHGQVAIDALFQAFSQLHNLGVFLGQHKSELTQTQRRGALRAISVIKEKRSGRIKGRTVADGRPQRTLYTKEETSSPTVSNDALMLSIIIDAWGRRKSATADVTGAYLHAKLKDFTLLRMEGESVDIMCNINEEYKKFVCLEHGKKVLYLKLQKALYGCVQSALLWYELFSGTLQELGFSLNPYDACVANKTINGKQCTIVWYVDDTKISHMDDKVITDVIAKIEESFGK
jgi:hypothetical protein